MFIYGGLNENDVTHDTLERFDMEDFTTKYIKFGEEVKPPPLAHQVKKLNLFIIF